MTKDQIMLGSNEAVLKAAALDAIEANNGKKEWSQQIHCAMLARMAAALFDIERSDERIQRLFVLLNANGAGGNASQFQQWLAKPDIAILPPKQKGGINLAVSLLK